MSDDTILDLLDGDIDVDKYLDDLKAGRQTPTPRAQEAMARELIVQSNGEPRQAGASDSDGLWVTRYRLRMETSLFSFTKGVLGRKYLTVGLHKGVCRFIQRCPPRRKLVLLPRECCKTSIVSHGLPLHLWIQGADLNRYFGGQEGDETRILLACETQNRASDHLRVLQSACEGNRKLRALWPHRFWDNPRKQAPKWNDVEMILPRKIEFPDPTIRAIGVGGAVTGSHPTVLIKDDLISVDAANSPTVMETARFWHTTSRALINDERCLEFTIGTRWAVGDLYETIQRDPTVQSMKRSLVENGRSIYPEVFTLPKIEQIRQEQGVMFPLLYMNEASDPSLTDFDMSLVRGLTFDGTDLVFSEDARDAMLLADPEPVAHPKQDRLRGQPFNSETYDRMRARDEYLTFKAG